MTLALKQTELRNAIARFYDTYHKYRDRRPNAWMQQVYWPAFYGSTLEVGGGTLLPRRTAYMLVDLSREAVMRAVAHGVPALVADGARLPFASRSFESVACYDVLEHVVEPVAFLAEMCRVARHRVIIAGPNYIGRYPGGISRYLPLRLWAYLEGSGRACPHLDEPYLVFDSGWAPDRDAVSAPNAGWVARQLEQHGLRVRHVRSWEYDHHWLNLVPAIRCLGPFMFIVGERP